MKLATFAPPAPDVITAVVEGHEVTLRKIGHVADTVPVTATAGGVDVPAGTIELELPIYVLVDG